MKSARLPNDLSQCFRLEVSQLSTSPSACLTAPVLPWEDPSEKLTLARGEIHLWRAWLDQPAPCLARCCSLLSEDECARAGRFRFEKDRGRFIARRGLLRMILGHYLRIEPARLRFGCGASGKPALSFPSDPGLYFNLSHSDGLADYAVTAEGMVGVDVERTRVVAEADAIVTRYFSSRETADWHSLSNNKRPHAFLTYWVRKEAFLKADGRGIAKALERVQIMQTKEGLNDESGLLDHSDAKTRCVVWDLIPAPDYVAALAFHSPHTTTSSSRVSEDRC